MKNWSILFILIIIPQLSFSQFDCVELLPDAKVRVFNDISYLASDELQGRKPGEEGAELAAKFLERSFKDIGLQQMAEDGYRQIFTIPSPVRFNDNNSFLYKGDAYELKTDYYPAQWSSNSGVEGKTIYVGFGISAPELEHDDYEGLKPKKLEGNIFVMDISSPDGIHPHSKYIKYHDLGERITLAREKGASGVILINHMGAANDLLPNFKKIHSRNIPVIFVNNDDIADKLLKKSRVSFVVDMEEQRVFAYNIMGLINNGKANTVIIGAHYDHLGWGAENSLYLGDDGPQIHNGADDNASGVAGLLELARNIIAADSGYDKSNYLFIAFSGEEQGLLGSAFFTQNMKDMDLEPKVMFNMDMIGRMEDNQLAVNGVGTSTHWKDLIIEKGCDELKIQASMSGVGPSDHTNFYYLEIPALHFFTGTHKDYHKPSDDVEGINVHGETRVLSYIMGLLREVNNIESFKFTPTKNESTKAPKFSVTLGVMPDYMFQGEGMKIDGVTKGKPADVAGLQAGDIVIQMGEVKVVDMTSYMNALAQFKKGEATLLKYKRGEEVHTTQVKF